MEERYVASVLLHAVGDTIGFKNGEWEFNHGKKIVDWEYTSEIINEYIRLGGSNGINLKGWHVSDDTVLHLATLASLIDPDSISSMSKLTQRATKEFLKRFDDLEGRAPGNTTVQALHQHQTKEIEWNGRSYETAQGGSGASMRTPGIGLAFHKDDQLSQLVSASILNSQITHNSAVGYLGGLTTAYFTSLAINDIDVEEWPFRLIELLRGDLVTTVIKKYRPDTLEDYRRDSEIFLNKWIRYVDLRFDDKKKPLFNRAMMNPNYRMHFYYKHFGYHKTKIIFPGSGGDDSVIIAYDCLLDSENHWDTLVIYSMLHLGDSDTVGCIAGAWFGAKYGFTQVPTNHTKHLEYKKELVDSAKKLFQMFGLK